MQERSKAIGQRLWHFVDERGCKIAFVTDEVWPTMELPPEMRFGWVRPLVATDEDSDKPILLLLVNPDLMARITERLSESELDAYLRVVETVVAAYIAEPNATREEINPVVNALDGDALQIWNDTDAHALDAGIVTMG